MSYITAGIQGIISLVVLIITFVNVFMPTVKSANTTSWSTSEVALWGVVGLLGIAGLLNAVAQIFGLG